MILLTAKAQRSEDEILTDETDETDLYFNE
jgi:hypothetical protein